MNPENQTLGCGKRMSGEYKDGGYWEMDCGDLGRLCPSCHKNQEEN